MPPSRRLASYVGVLDNAGQRWVHNPLGIFCFCAACTHLGSMLTHIWPDSHTLVRYDRVCCNGMARASA